MANVEHKNLPEAELHEVKGASTASANEVLVADGAGSTDFTAQNPAYAQGNIEGNSTATSISASGSGNEVAINMGGSFASDSTNKFTISTAGLLTYTGTKTIDAIAMATVQLVQSGGGSKEYIVEWAKNGTVIASSAAEFETNGTDPNQGACNTYVSLAENDTLQLFIRNETDTTNVTAQTVSVTVFQLGF